jgi:hypothetical protein
MEILRSLYVEDALDVQVATIDDAKYLVIDVDERVGGEPRLATLAELLGLAASTSRLVFSTNPFEEREDVIRLTTRSVMGVMFYLSHATEVPARDIDGGRVTVTREADGSAFDWGQVGGRFMRIRSSASRPSGVAMAVRHRGSWFFIDDEDLNSKSTFVMLSQAIALQAGEIESTGPLLTLPVSR